MGRRVALLRAVNVGGRKLPMVDLRALCAELGWTDVATYIQSGNVVFTADGSDAAVETALEKAVAKAFGFESPVIVRTAAEWAKLPTTNPFPATAKDEPNRLMLLLSKRPPALDAAEIIQARAAHDEQVRRVGDAIWIHFPSGQADSKLTPASIDKAIGSPATGRNYNTVIKLLEMVTT
ncbi:MAG TPA: DUF1697 domain-containing protein [Allosphingosinicella sp.]